MTIGNPFNPVRFTGRGGLVTIEEVSRLEDLINRWSGDLLRQLNQAFFDVDVIINTVTSTPGPAGPPGPAAADSFDDSGGTAGGMASVTQMARVWLFAAHPSFPYGTVVTPSTGLTLGAAPTGNLTANLSTGVAGGQTAIGGTGASENLTFSSTTNGAKGKFIFGSTTGMQYDEQNAVFSIGIASPAPQLTAHYKFTSPAAGRNLIYVQNATASGYSGIRLGAADDATSGITGGIDLYNSGYAASGEYGPGVLELVNFGGSGNIRIGVLQNAGGIRFTTKVAETLRMEIASGGAVTITDLSAGGWVRTGAGTGTLTAQAWPATTQIIVSGGTTGTPDGSPDFNYDTNNDILSLGDDSTTYFLGDANTPTGNYKAARFQWGTIFATSSFIIKAVKGGSGTISPIAIDADTSALYLCATGATGQVNIAGNPGSTPGVVWGQTQVTYNGNITKATATSMTLDAHTFGSGSIVFSGGTAITTGTGVNFAAFTAPTYTTSVAITAAATVVIYGAPSISGGGSITAPYALWVQNGKTSFDGDTVVNGNGKNLGFFGSPGTTIQTVTGSRGGNAALASLLTKLANYGLIVDSSS